MATGSARAMGAALVLVLGGCGNRERLRTVEAAVEAPAGLDFGRVRIGQKAYAQARLDNPTAATIRVRGIEAQAPFEGVRFDTALVLPPGGSARVRLGFTPANEGPVSQDATVLSDADQAGALHLKGFGAQVRLSAPDKLDFGSIDLDQSRTLPLTLQNQGNIDAQVSLDAIDGPDAALFEAVGRQVTVPAGGSADLGLTFRGAHLGTSLATARLLPCEGCAAVEVPLSGAALATAVSVQPDRVVFGRVPVGGSEARPVTIANVGLQPFTLEAVYVTSDSDAAFQMDPVAPCVINPGDRKEVTVRFSPTAGGLRHGTVRVQTTDSRSRRIDVPLEGGGAALQSVVDPLAVDFGEVPVGMTARRSVVLYNTSSVGSITMNYAKVTSGLRFAGGALYQAIGPGDHVVIPVSFSPHDPVASQGVLEIETDEGGGSTLQVTLTGTGISPPPCQWAAHPASLDFGNSRPNEVRHLAVALEDVGQDDCYFGDIDLAGGSDPAFSLTDGAVPGMLLHPGDVVTVRVSFVPPASGSYQGALNFLVSDPAHPTGSVNITGQAVQGCLLLDPANLDFGTVRGGCGARALSFTATNTCAGPLDLASVALGAGDSAEFALTQGQTGAHTLAAGASEVYTATYQPVNDGPDSQVVQVTLGDGAVQTVTLEGNGVMSPTQTDHFAQKERTKVDQLFILDNSGSLADKQQQLTANFQTFINEAVNQDVDYHIAATTTGIIPATGGWSTCPGGVEGGEAGRLFPADGSSLRIITPATSDPTAAFGSMVNVGTCHWLEQGLEGAYLALSQPLVDSADDPATPLLNDGNLGFFRDDARLSIIVISDADDQSDQSLDFYENFFRNLKHNQPGQLIFSAVTTPLDKATSCPNGESVGTRYIQAAQDLGGVVENICSSDWGATLGRLAKAAFGPATRFPLTAVPSDATQITVVVNGRPATDGWTYDPATNSVVFDQASAPPAGSNVDITYPLGC